MMEEFHVAYLSHYHWQDPDEGPDMLVACRFVARSKEDALQLAKTKIPHVIAAYTDRDDEVTEEHIEITVRSWAEWGNKLDKNWDAICETELEEEDE